jgi:response regulator RpfG family c-di-GMP phosphodiesterase
LNVKLQDEDVDMNSAVLKDEKKKKVLIVEDEETFRNLLGQIFYSEGFEVRFAENGLVAKTILSLNANQFDLVISDIKMPEMDGVTLLKDVRGIHPGTRFIMMSGFSEVIETQDAFMSGADGFLPKPFKTRHLLETVESVFRVKEEPADPSLIEEDEFSFCKIHVDEFTSASTLPSDIYIRLGDNKFVKVGREGAVIQVHRIQTYKEKKVEYFYVHNKDFQKYAGFTLRLVKAAAASKKITREQKLKLFKHTGEILLNQIFIQDLKKEDIELSQNVVNNTLNLIGEEPEIFDLINFLQTHSDSTYAHSVAVSVYSVLVAKKMCWSSQPTLLKLSLGGLFHDIGKKEIPSKLLTKERREMKADEIAIYESHPQRSKAILESLPGFPGDVIQIAFQHHENNLGTGYPLGMSQMRIHPLAKVIHLTDEFFHLCQKYRGHDDKPWNVALRELWDLRAGEIEPLPLKALMEVFDFPVPAPLLKIKPPRSA